MSWRGKRKDEEVRASDDESETHAPAKKVAKPAESSDESDDIVVCNVSPLSLPPSLRLSLSHCVCSYSI